MYSMLMCLWCLFCLLLIGCVLFIVLRCSIWRRGEGKTRPGACGEAELWLFVGFLCFVNMLYQNSTRISPECHRNSTRIPPEFHRNSRIPEFHQNFTGECFTRIPPEFHQNLPEFHQNFTGMSAEFHQNSSEFRRNFAVRSNRSTLRGTKHNVCMCIYIYI